MVKKDKYIFTINYLYCGCFYLLINIPTIYLLYYKYYVISLLLFLITSIFLYYLLKPAIRIIFDSEELIVKKAINKIKYRIPYSQLIKIEINYKTRDQRPIKILFKKNDSITEIHGEALFKSRKDVENLQKHIDSLMLN